MKFSEFQSNRTSKVLQLAYDSVGQKWSWSSEVPIHIHVSNHTTLQDFLIHTMGYFG